MHQQLLPNMTAWHLTVGTYGSRLHGNDRPTVDRQHNQRGEAFVTVDPEREAIERERMRGPAVYLTREQCLHIQAALPEICRRGGWHYRICAAPPPPENNHFHLLCDAHPSRHGKDIRKWLKRWLSESLDQQWGRPAGGSWWVEDGSTKPVDNDAYLNNSFNYIERQRTPE